MVDGLIVIKNIKFKFRFNKGREIELTIPCSCCDCYLQQSLSPYPSSPLTPDSEEGFIMNVREEGRSTRVRNRPKPQPAKKTRVNAQRYVITLCK